MPTRPGGRYPSTMAKGRRPQGSGRSPVPVGSASRPGRELSFASRNSLLLPRAIASAPSSAHKQFHDLQIRRARIRRTAPYSVPVKRQILRRAVQLMELRTPSLAKLTSPCVRRAKRRQVMFANQVAGRKWGRGGGPDMRRARHNETSSFKCRR